MDNPTSLVFVYGSLLSGLGNHGILARGGAELVAKTTTVEKFTMYSLGAFPACVPNGATQIVGEVWRVDAATLAMLDRLEGYHGDGQGLYDRISVHCDGGILALMYVMHEPRWNPVPVPSGDWRDHHANHQEWRYDVDNDPGADDDDDCALAYGGDYCDCGNGCTLAHV